MPLLGEITWIRRLTVRICGLCFILHVTGPSVESLFWKDGGLISNPAIGKKTKSQGNKITDLK